MNHLGYFDLIDLYLDVIRNHGAMSTDTYFEGGAENFDSVAHTYVNWEVRAEWDALVERGGPLVVVTSYEDEAEREDRMHVSTFIVIVDYVALQYWKHGQGRKAHLEEARWWMDALMKGAGLERLLEWIREWHPIAVEVIRAGEAEREAEREVEREAERERAMARCHAIEEELLMNRWHPSRIERLLALGYAAGEI